VTGQAITARNRANAAKSTGPRSAAGKAVVAQNARRHGATARPDPERVSAWARIILDTPDPGLGHLLADDPHTRRALAVARAEARCVATGRALAAHVAAMHAPSAATEDIRSMMREIVWEVRTSKTTARERRKVDTLWRRAARLESRERERAGIHRRLLERYWREARAQRKRAFRDWVASLREQAESRSAQGEGARIPKQSQDTT
jgi:hypothetical protein